MAGFSNWKNVAGGNCKVAGALFRHDNGDSPVQSTPSCTGESDAPLENFENQGAWKFIPVNFIAFIADFVEGDDTLIN